MDSDKQKRILLSKAFRIIHVHVCDKNMIDAFCSEILNDMGVARLRDCFDKNNSFARLFPKKILYVCATQFLSR